MGVTSPLLVLTSASGMAQPATLICRAFAHAGHIVFTA